MQQFDAQREKQNKSKSMFYKNYSPKMQIIMKKKNSIHTTTTTHKRNIINEIREQKEKNYKTLKIARITGTKVQITDMKNTRNRTTIRKTRNINS